MTKAVLDIDSELWKQARTFALANDLNNAEVVTLALERLLLPVAGRTIPEVIEQPKNITPMPPEEIERRTLPPKAYPSFGRSYPAPKPMKRK